eukprot:Rmarinus@m.17898
MGLCFVIEVLLTDTDWPEFFLGTVYPRLPARGENGEIPAHGDKSAFIAVSLLGAVVMPHNLYLHSAIVQSRKIERRPSAIKEAIYYNQIESGLSLFVSLVINLAVVCVAVAAFPEGGTTEDISLEDAGELLQDHLFQSAATLAPILWAIALLASGQTSTMTGTYAGQFVMQGFLNISISPFKRNLVTRLFALGPSMAVALIGGQHSADSLIVWSSVVLSFQLPFALVPLLKFTSEEKCIGAYGLHPAIKALSWSLGLLTIGANIFLVFEQLRDVISSGTAFGNFVLALVVIVGTGYFGLLVYLIQRPVSGFSDCDVDANELLERESSVEEISTDKYSSAQDETLLSPDMPLSSPTTFSPQES